MTRKYFSADPKWLLDNPHRLLAVMEPDPDFNQKMKRN